jgi:predicted lipoprotein with Yx(FWY)xxD motif
MRKTKLTAYLALVCISALAVAAFASASTSTISLRKTAVGKVLVANNGRTLYLLTADKAKRSTCYGQCASYWPPLIAGHPTGGAGLKQSLLGTTKRKDGKLQVTYGGHPLYFFVQDKKAGDVHGQGIVNFGGAWWAVSAAGGKVTAKP